MSDFTDEEVVAFAWDHYGPDLASALDKLFDSERGDSGFAKAVRRSLAREMEDHAESAT